MTGKYFFPAVKLEYESKSITSLYTETCILYMHAYIINHLWMQFIICYWSNMCNWAVWDEVGVGM